MRGSDRRHSLRLRAFASLLFLLVTGISSERHRDERQRVVAIGDIHGDLDSFVRNSSAGPADRSRSDAGRVRNRFSFKQGISSTVVPNRVKSWIS